MAWYFYALSAAGGLLLGSAVAFLNMRLSKRVIHRNNIALIMGVNILRYLFDAAALAAVFFICRAIDFPITLPLLSVAVGLSVIGMLFLELMTKREEKQDAAEDDGGE